MISQNQSVPSPEGSNKRSLRRSRAVNSVAVAFAALTTAMGVFVLIAWALAAQQLSALGPDFMPMAPSTALMFIVLGALSIVSMRYPDSSMHQKGAIIIAATCIVTVLALFVLSLYDLYLDIEHLGIPVGNRPGAFPPGHMSPITALCFAMAALSLLQSLLSRRVKGAGATAGFWPACGTLLASLVMLTAYMRRTPLLYGGTMIPPALSTTLVFAALGASLLLRSLQEMRHKKHPDDSHERHLAAALALTFIAMGTGIVSTGYLYLENYERNYRRQAEAQLSAIGELKAAEIMQWRKERLSGAALFGDNRYFSGLVMQYLQKPDSDARDQIMMWMSKLMDAYHYNRIALYDVAGVKLIRFPSGFGSMDSLVPGWAIDTVNQARPQFRDFYRDPRNERIYLSTLTPILDTGKLRVIGILEMRIDPGEYLFPLIKDWSLPSRTAETLLLRREGNSAVFLNELRFAANTALNLRMPLSDTSIAGVKAVLGDVGIVEAIDYRGKPVIADIRPIPQTPWYMVARIDTEEVFSPLRKRLREITLLVVIILVGTGAVIGSVWRRRRIRYYKERLAAIEALRESDARYRRTLDSMMEGCQIIGFDLKYLYVNSTGVQHARLPRESLLGRTLMEIYPGIEKTELFLTLKECMEHRTPRFFDKHHQYFDGSSAWFEFSVQPVSEGLFILTIDITERKQAEQARRQLTVELEQKNRELEQILYVSTHDLRSPLVNVQGFCRELGLSINDLFHAIDSFKLDEAARCRIRPILKHDIPESLGYITTSIARMDALLSGLLRLSRMGRAALMIQTLDMKKVIDSAIQIFVHTINARGAVIEIAGDLPGCRGDELQVNQVVSNLLDNALKYAAPQRLCRIVISGHIEGNRAIYCVEDNGIGIAPEHCEKAFEIFHRLNPSDSAGGEGLGLTIVRRILERLNGHIWVESEKGTGSRFCFALPAAQAFPPERTHPAVVGAGSHLYDDNDLQRG